MASQERPKCEPARGCPGWFVTEDIYVRRCHTCSALAGNDDARESALAAGLDVQRSGYVAGVSGMDMGPERPSAEQRATAAVNRLLTMALDDLQDAQRVPHLPAPLRSCVDHLAVEVAKAQGISEWLAEELVQLAEDSDEGEELPGG